MQTKVSNNLVKGNYKRSFSEGNNKVISTKTTKTKNVTEHQKSQSDPVTNSKTLKGYQIETTLESKKEYYDKEAVMQAAERLIQQNKSKAYITCQKIKIGDNFNIKETLNLLSAEKKTPKELYFEHPVTNANIDRFQELVHKINKFNVYRIIFEEIKMTSETEFHLDKFNKLHQLEIRDFQGGQLIVKKSKRNKKYPNIEVHLNRFDQDKASIKIINSGLQYILNESVFSDYSDEAKSIELEKMTKISYE